MDIIKKLVLLRKIRYAERYVIKSHDFVHFVFSKG